MLASMAQEEAHSTPEPTVPDDPRKRRALEGMVAHGTYAAAARYAGVSRCTVKYWVERDEDFAELLHEAHEEHVDNAVEELHRRAVVGDERVVYYKGEPVIKRDPHTGDPILDDDFNVVYYTRREKSDALLPVYLKSKRPEFRDRTDLTLMGPGGGPIRTETETTFRISFVDSPHADAPMPGGDEEAEG